MSHVKERSWSRPAGLPLLLFSLVALYIVLQFTWWAWLLLEKDREVLALQQQLLREGVAPGIPVRMPHRTLWMLAGEGGVFLSLVLLALWIIFRTVKHELALARQQRDFLLAASHELRTPIAGLKLHLQTSQRPGLDQEKRDGLAASMRTEVDRLHGLTEKILLATRLDVTSAPLQRTPLDASAILSAVCASGAVTFGAGHVIRCAVPPGITILGDADAFRSIAENLLENACKYSPVGSEVEVALDREGDRVELRVSDEGIGVPEAERQLIFRKFHRGGREETRGTKGTGLGLYIVERSAHASGGRVEHRARSPRGSIFAASFPST